MANKLSLRFDSIEELRAEFESHLKRGGGFVPGEHELTAQDVCEFELTHPVRGDHMVFNVKVVWVAPAPNCGVGLAIESFGPQLRQQILDFIEGESLAQPEQTTGGSLQERMRGLSRPQQLKIAREGDPRERVALERIYGKGVWAVLLTNPRLTSPEVARMARMGTLPKPQLDVIVANRSWLQSPAVRRALLSNARLSREGVRGVLRMLPKHELKLAVKQTTYPVLVRQEATRMMG